MADAAWRGERARLQAELAAARQAAQEDAEALRGMEAQAKLHLRVLEEAMEKDGVEIERKEGAWERERGALRAELEGQRRAVEALELALAREREAGDELREREAAMAAQLNGAGARLQASQAKAATLEETVGRYKAGVAKLRERFAADQQAREEAWSRERRTLAADLDALHGKGEEAARLHGRVQQLVNELELNRAAAGDAMAAKEAEWAAKFQALERGVLSVTEAGEAKTQRLEQRLQKLAAQAAAEEGERTARHAAEQQQRQERGDASAAAGRNEGALVALLLEKEKQIAALERDLVQLSEGAEKAAGSQERALELDVRCRALQEGLQHAAAAAAQERQASSVRISSLEMDLAGTVNELHAAQEWAAGLQQDLQSASHQLAEAGNRMRQLQELNAQLEGALADAAVPTENVLPGHDGREQGAAHLERAMQLEANCRQLEDMLQHTTEAARKESSQHLKQISSLGAEMRDMGDQLQAARDWAGGLQEQLQKALEASGDAQKRLSQLQESCDLLNKQATEARRAHGEQTTLLQDQLAAATEELARISEQSCAYAKTIEGLQADLVTADGALEARERALDIADSTVDEMRQLLHEAEAKLQAMQSEASGSRKQLENDLASVEEQEAHIQARLREREEAVEALQETVLELKKKLAKALEIVDAQRQLEQGLRDALKQAESRRAATSVKVSTLEATLRTLLEDLHTSENVALSQQEKLQKVTRMHLGLKQNVLHLQEHVAQLSEELVKAADAQEKVVELGNAVLQLEEKLKQAATLRQVEEVQHADEVALLRLDLSELAGRLQASNAMAVSQEEDLKQERSAGSILEQQVQVIKATLKGVRRDAIEEQNALQKQLKDAQFHNTHVAKALEQSKLERDETKSELENSNKDLQDAKITSSDSERGLRTEIALLRQMLQAAEMTVLEAKKDAQHCDAALRELQCSMSDAQEIIAAKSNALERAEDRHREMEETVVKQELRLHTLQEELDERANTGDVQYGVQQDITAAGTGVGVKSATRSDDLVAKCWELEALVKDLQQQVVVEKQHREGSVAHPGEKIVTEDRGEFQPSNQQILDKEASLEALQAQLHKDGCSAECGRSPARYAPEELRQCAADGPPQLIPGPEQTARKRLSSNDREAYEERIAALEAQVGDLADRLQAALEEESHLQEGIDIMQGIMVVKSDLVKKAEQELAREKQSPSEGDHARSLDIIAQLEELEAAVWAKDAEVQRLRASKAELRAELLKKELELKAQADGSGLLNERPSSAQLLAKAEPWLQLRPQRGAHKSSIVLRQSAASQDGLAPSNVEQDCNGQGPEHLQRELDALTQALQARQIEMQVLQRKLAQASGDLAAERSALAQMQGERAESISREEELVRRARVLQEENAALRIASHKKDEETTRLQEQGHMLKQQVMLKGGVPMEGAPSAAVGEGERRQDEKQQHELNHYIDMCRSLVRINKTLQKRVEKQQAQIQNLQPTDLSSWGPTSLLSSKQSSPDVLSGPAKENCSCNMPPGPRPDADLRGHKNSSTSETVRHKSTQRKPRY
eukprot:SM000005S17243  [mRNA]  locus=s5:980044:986583:+ [translate_table: standard]